MARQLSSELGRWMTFLGRSLVVGAVAGVASGWLLYFLFGFVGLTAAPLISRLENGWQAAVRIGSRRGLIVGVSITVLVVAATAVWIGLTEQHRVRQARPWLTAVAAASVVLFNLSSLRNIGGWDEVGLLTVAGMAGLVAGTVWLVSPWALRLWESYAPVRSEEAAGRRAG